MNLLTAPLTGAISLYQRYISPAFPRRCRYYPTCSAYALESLQTHGFFKGMLLAIWRLLRCNPWSKGGVDHVPPRGRWKPDPFPSYSELVKLHQAEK